MGGFRVRWGPTFWFIDGAFSLGLGMMETVNRHSGATFMRKLILHIGTLPSWPNHIPKPPSPNTITLGMRVWF